MKLLAFCGIIEILSTYATIEDDIYAYTYTKMDGWCRNPGNGILHPKSNNEWGYCLKGKWDLSACKNKCDADKDCWAFDRETKALSECCLFGHGNLGHSCFVAEEKGYKKTPGFCRDDKKNPDFYCVKYKDGGKKKEMDLSACRNKCDADKDCQAFDRYDVNGLSECCLFRKGNRTYTGNAKNRTCFVRSTACKEGDEFTLTNDEAALRAAFNGTDLEWHDEMKQMLGRRYVLKKQSDAPPGTCLLPYKDDKSWLFPFSAATKIRRTIESTECRGRNCQVTVGCDEGWRPIECEARYGKKANGAYWSADAISLKVPSVNTGIMCTALGAGDDDSDDEDDDEDGDDDGDEDEDEDDDGEPVRAWVACVPATDKDVYEVVDPVKRGYIKNKYLPKLQVKGESPAEQLNVSCRTGFKAISCNCISLWDKCPKSKWKGFSPEHGVCSVSDGGDSAGVAASALCIQLGSLMHDGLKSRLDQSTLACVLNSKRRFSHSHAMHEAASRHELAVVADLERCARSKATLKTGEFLYVGEGLCLTLPCSNAVAGERYTGYDNRYRSDEVCPRPETSDCDCDGIDRSIWDKIAILKCCKCQLCCLLPSTSCSHCSMSIDARGHCPKEACNQSALRDGQYFAPPTLDANCSNLIRNCSTGPIPAGWMFHNKSRKCTLVKCAPKAGEYYDGSNACSSKICTNVPEPGFQYASNNWVTDASECRVERCPAEAPVGKYFHSGCKTMSCTNAPPGSEYLSNGGTGKECAYAPSGKDKNQAPSQPGHYFPDDSNKHNPQPCELRKGWYYLHGATGGESGCKYVRSQCTNAKLGQQYAPQVHLVTNKSGCPVEACSDPGIGKDFAIPGSCDQFVSCTNALVGEYYIKSKASHTCQVAKCANAFPGEYYEVGNANVDPQCPVGKCEIFPGYTFEPTGQCTQMQRCDVPRAGYFYKYSQEEVCAEGKCVYDSRENWKFIPAFVLRSDSCPRQECPGEPPNAYASIDSCSPATTTGADMGSGSSGGLIVPILACTGSVVMVVGIIVVVLFVMAKTKRKNFEDTSLLEGESKPARKKVHSIATKAAYGARSTDLILNPGDVTVGSKLAGGAGGQVFRGRFGHSDVALKESFQMLCNGKNEEMVREAGMMTKLRHPNVVTFFGICQKDKRVFLVMEFCLNGDLRSAARNPQSTIAERKRWLVQVAWAMQYLHQRSPPIVHRDLKPQNVLLDAKWDAKVCDFGISHTARKSHDVKTMVGTLAYMAPELMESVFSEANDQATKCDVFSFAVLALYVATGKTPHAGLNNEDIFLKVRMNGGRTSIPRGYAGTRRGEDNSHSYGQFVDLVKRMWHTKPQDRPDFDTITAELEKVFEDIRL